MGVFSTVFFFICFVSVYGTPCSDITGVWANNEHETLTAFQIDVQIGGVYKVMTEEGVLVSYRIRGLMKRLGENASLIGFTSIVNKGATVITWVGQCTTCDGRPKISTTWIEQSITPPHEKAMSTRVNQTTFWKMSPLYEQPPFPVSHEDSLIGVDFVGTWASESGDKFQDFRIISSNNIAGFHKVQDGAQDILYGLVAGNETYTSYGFVSASATRMRGWAGHVHNPLTMNDKELETSWLSHGYTENCGNAREDVLVGMDNYSRKLLGTPCTNISGVWYSDKRPANISVIQNEGFPAVLKGLYSESFTGYDIGYNRLTGLLVPMGDGGSLVAFNSIYEGEDTIIAWVGQCMVCDGQETLYTTWVERSKFLVFEETTISTRVNRETYRRVVPQPEEPPQRASYAVQEDFLFNVDIRLLWRSFNGDRFNFTDVVPHDTISGYHLTLAPHPAPLNGIVDRQATFMVLGFASAGRTSIKGWTGHIYNPRPVVNVIETSWLDHTFKNSCSNPRANVKYGQDIYAPVLYASP